MQACSILYKTKLPLLLVFNKVDVARHQFALDWMADFETFHEALQADSSYASSLSRSLSLVSSSAWQFTAACKGMLFYGGKFANIQPVADPEPVRSSADKLLPAVLKNCRRTSMPTIAVCCDLYAHVSRTVLLPACTEMCKACLHSKTCARRTPGPHAVLSLSGPGQGAAGRCVAKNVHSNSLLDVSAARFGGSLTTTLSLAAVRLHGCTATSNEQSALGGASPPPGINP